MKGGPDTPTRVQQLSTLLTNIGLPVYATLGILACVLMVGIPSEPFSAEGVFVLKATFFGSVGVLLPCILLACIAGQQRKKWRYRDRAQDPAPEPQIVRAVSDRPRA